MSFQTRDFSPKGCWFGQLLSVNTVFGATDDMCSESLQYSMLTQLTTKSILPYVLLGGEAWHACDP